MREKYEKRLAYWWGDLEANAVAEHICEIALIMLYHCHLEAPSEEWAVASGTIFMSSRPS